MKIMISEMKIYTTFVLAALGKIREIFYWMSPSLKIFKLGKASIITFDYSRIKSFIFVIKNSH